MPEKPRETKHHSIFNHLHQQIVAGRYKLGERLPSETGLARKFGTTRVTVSKALRGLVQAGLLERRRGSGSYIRQPAASDTRLLGLIVPGLGQGEIFEPICTAIASHVQAQGYTLLWGHGPSGPAVDRIHEAESLCQRYIDQKVSGVFFCPIELQPNLHEANQRITNRLDQAGIPIVLLDTDVVSFPRRSRYDIVGIDNRRAGYLQAHHLLEQGCRHIGYVHHPLSAPTIEGRIAGCREAIANWDPPASPLRVFSGDLADEAFIRELVQPPMSDGFVCGNDFTAAQLLRGLCSLGIATPRQVRVVGIDDVKLAGLLSVPLTSIRQPCAEIGVAAVQAMFQRIAHPTQRARDILLDIKLVVRESSVVGDDTLSAAPHRRRNRSAATI